MMTASRKRILLIDDDDDHLFLTKIKLERLNQEFDVDVAKSAEEGLEKLHAKEFDCVISDYNMSPGMNGLDLLRSLQHDEPAMPAILVSTGDRSDLDYTKLKDDGITFIQKSPGDGYIEDITRSIKYAIAKRDPGQPLEALEERLKEVELQSQRYRTFFHSAREVGILLDLDGKTIVEINGSAICLFGPNEVNRGCNILMHVQYQDRIAVSQLILKILSGQKEQSTIRFIVGDCSIKRLHIGGACIRSGGQVKGVVLYGTEATDAEL